MTSEVGQCPMSPLRQRRQFKNYSLDDLNRGAGLAVKLVVDRLPMDVPTDDWGLPSRGVRRLPGEKEPRTK